MQYIAYLTPLFYNIPYYILWMLGIVYAFVHRKKHPKTSLYASLGFGIMLIESFTSTLLSAYFQYQAIRLGGSVAEMGGRMQALAFCTIPLSMISWFLLLVAIFGWKKLTDSEPFTDAFQ